MMTKNQTRARDLLLSLRDMHANLSQVTGRQPAALLLLLLAVVIAGRRLGRGSSATRSGDGPAHKHTPDTAMPRYDASTTPCPTSSPAPLSAPYLIDLEAGLVGVEAPERALLDQLEALRLRQAEDANLHPLTKIQHISFVMISVVTGKQRQLAGSMVLPTSSPACAGPWAPRQSPPPAPESNTCKLYPSSDR